MKATVPVCFGRRNTSGLWGGASSFNCYRQHSILYLKSADGRDFEIIHSQEGVIQGGLLAMIAYVISLLPIIIILCKEFQDIFQLWFADDGEGRPPTQHLIQLFNLLTVLGPKSKYFPEESNSILIVETKGVDRKKNSLVHILSK